MLFNIEMNLYVSSNEVKG